MTGQPLEPGDGGPQARPLRPARRPRGRRRRSLGWALGVAGLLAAAGAVAGWLTYRALRPEVRRPGEQLPEVTRKLAQGLPAGAPAPRFAEVSEAAGLGGFESFRGPRTSQLPEDMGPGLAWGDYDGDGDDDLFLVSAGGALTLEPGRLAPSELYENLGDGTFRRAEGFPDLRIHGMAAAWGDYDGDGRPDLAVTGYRVLALFHNEGGGRFAPAPALPAPDGFWAGAAWGDFDLDRDLDLYVCGYVRYRKDLAGAERTSKQYGAAVPYTLNPASFPPQPNLLFENLGAGAFAEVAAALGVDDPHGRSLSALWHDFDDDGRLDLYVANDISDNALLLNRGDRFEDAGLAAWVADYRGAMGLAAGDWNRDGDDDLFVTHWVAQENALYDSRLADLPAAAGDAGESEAPSGLRFTDVAALVGLGQIALPMVGWGTELADLDSDGWLDLPVANGSTFETGDEPKRLQPQPLFLFWNHQGRSFHDLAPADAGLARPRVGRGLAVADYDGDGDLDIALATLDDGVVLLRNDLPQGRWLEVRLRSRLAGDRPSQAPKEARGAGDGASLVARFGATALRRSITGASYLSQSSRQVHFGLGDATAADLEVRWLGGDRQLFPGLAAGARWELVEGDPEPRRLDAPAGEVAQVDEHEERERRVAFWELQRAAMDALKRDGDCPRAIGLFRRALALDPAHEDARYYLANCLAEQGDVDAALAELERLLESSPNSHRGLRRWATLRAAAATTPAELGEAEAALERALAINREETGTLLVLGEVALLRGDGDHAAERLEQACRTNPRAVGGFFLRGYLAWKGGDDSAARELLARAGEARGPEWKPEGAAAEGDVAHRQHRDETPLEPFWRRWDGAAEPAAAFAELDRFLAGYPAAG